MHACMQLPGDDAEELSAADKSVLQLCDVCGDSCDEDDFSPLLTSPSVTSVDGGPTISSNFPPTMAGCKSPSSRSQPSIWRVYSTPSGRCSLCRPS